MMKTQSLDSSPTGMFSLNSKHRMLLNGLMFQALWFVCIFTSVEITLFATAAYLVLHYLLVERSSLQWAMLLLIALLGYAADSILTSFAIIGFKQSIHIGPVSLAPLWLACLWLGFSSCVKHAFGFLHNKRLLTILLCFTVIPFNYFVGANIREAVIATPQLFSFLLIALYWAFLLPFALKLTKGRVLA